MSGELKEKILCLSHTHPYNLKFVSMRLGGKVGRGKEKRTEAYSQVSWDVERCRKRSNVPGFSCSAGSMSGNIKKCPCLYCFILISISPFPFSILLSFVF